VEGITGKKHDIIFLSDCRLGNKRPEIERMMGLNRNASYKMYAHSTGDARGVAIAIKRSIPHTVIDCYYDLEENIILLRVRVQGKDITLGAIYGPNSNDANFYHNLRRRIEGLGTTFVIGGDFNTILDRQHGPDNMDREGGGGKSSEPG